MNDYQWRPIEPLAGQDREDDFANMQPLYDAWRASKLRLEESSEDSLRRFTERLVRRLSVETGILERIYDLDRGTTEALVATGFLDDLVSRSNTDIEPSHLIDILRDQEAAIQLVMDCVGHRRGLTKGFLHELHAVLTKHQDSTVAIDQFGRRREIALLKGCFKKYPNNPRGPDGSTHEYCPVLQVEAEVERLLGLFSEYSDDDPIIVAAWLHHRFTQIHPYQDGNGRVARALVTLVLLRAQLLPLVIDRDLRVEYLEALQAADRGELSSLTSMFARLERAAILEALSVDVDDDVAHDRSLTSAVIESLARKFERRKQAKEAELREVNGIAKVLRERAEDVIDGELNLLAKPLSEVYRTEVFVKLGGPDHGNAHWYRNEVIRSAKEAGKYANLEEDHYFVKGAIRAGRERLIFVVSFHHIGRELSGIMEATAFSKLESYDNSDDWQAASQENFVCSLEPFVFTYRTPEKGMAGPFAKWLDRALAVAMKEYGDRL